MIIPILSAKDVAEFIAEVADPIRRGDCERLMEVVGETTGEQPALWGGIVGFGIRHYKYATGREGDTMKIGVSPRKQALTLYGLMLQEGNAELLSELGPHEVGKGCLYIKRLDRIDLNVLRRMIKAAYESYEP